MNALAEDQLDRLCGLLAGFGIPFGIYVGKTPEEEAEVRAERMITNPRLRALLGLDSRPRLRRCKECEAGRLLAIDTPAARWHDT